MGKYVKEWEAIKAKFEASAGIKRPTETVKNAMLGDLKKASGLTPMLQEIDTALEKKQRAPLEKALNRYHNMQEPYVAFLRTEMKKYSPDTDEDIVLAFGNFMREMLGIEDKVSADAKALQEEKSPGATAIKWLFLEADVKGTIDKAKKDFIPYAAFEKRFGLVKKSEPAFESVQKYTKAAARTEVANALKALKEFQANAKACATACNTALHDKEALKVEKYIDAVKSYQSAMSSLATASRTEAQVKNLEAMGG